jgi:hypothetical protein
MPTEINQPSYIKQIDNEIHWALSLCKNNLTQRQNENKKMKRRLQNRAILNVFESLAGK